MTLADQFLLAQEAYQQILEEMQPGESFFVPPLSSPGFNPNEQHTGPLPDGYISLGIATDDLPVLLNLRNPGSGPILIAGDGGAGKTKLLKYLALQTESTLLEGDILFGVLSNNVDEWIELESCSSSLGIWSYFHTSSADFLSRLIFWSESVKNSHQFILLLVDDLDLACETSLVVKHALHWLFENGPVNHIWPFVSMRSQHLTQNKSWLDYFKTTIYGYTDLEDLIPALAIDEMIHLNELSSGRCFRVNSMDGWLDFSIPQS